MRIRLFGGFEVWAGDRRVDGFESQKVRALLVYLACHRGRAFSRDHLAGLLWPEKSAETVRHALRQAAYNLRSRLASAGVPPILHNHLELGFEPEAPCWLDVEAFDEALRRGAGRDMVDSQQLAAAVQLFRGDFLAGFFVKDSPAFEEWVLGEQERLREGVVEALRMLIESYRMRGEYRFGVHYARRLVAIDPLSEAAHRDLMRLSALAGRRGGALAQYEELCETLRRELGVEPSDETRALYEEIAREGPVEATPAEEGEPVGPLVPLAGRQPAWEALREGWRRMLAGRSRLTLVEGEPGAGKTRLVRSFLDAATSQQRAIVLTGRAWELAPIPYLPLVQALDDAVAEAVEGGGRAAALAAGGLADLAVLSPGLSRLRHEGPPPPAAEPDRGRLAAAVADLLAGLCRQGRGSRPVVLFLDDLHLADRDTIELLGELLPALEGTPLWVLATCASGLPPGHPLLALATAADARRVAIGRLEPDDVEEIAESLVGEDQAPELGRFLMARSAGLPLDVAELVNVLWDEGAIAADAAGHWRLARPLAELELPAEIGIGELVLRRVGRLPASTRRLLTLAAVAGQSFETELLQRAAGEHPKVVEIGLELLLERWLLRQSSGSWHGSRRERDIVLWAKGARRGRFEFAHGHIREAIYRDLDPERRRIVHGQLAAALEALHGEADWEVLAHHWAAAGEWERAGSCAGRAAERARRLGAGDAERHYRAMAHEAAKRLRTPARAAAR